MLRRLVLVAGLAGGTVLLVAAPVGAVLSPECDGSAEIQGDDLTVTVDGSTTERVTLPRKADVIRYQGSIDLPPGEEYTHGGGADLDSPFGSLQSWSWGGETKKVATSGTTSYDLDLPAGILGGVKVHVSGSHTQGGITCTGSFDGTIGGSAVNPGSLGSAAVTAVAAAGLGLAAFGKAP